jgi:hypothetical protein
LPQTPITAAPDRSITRLAIPPDERADDVPLLLIAVGARSSLSRQSNAASSMRRSPLVLPAGLTAPGSPGSSLPPWSRNVAAPRNSARVMTDPSAARKLDTTRVAGTTAGLGFGAGLLAERAAGERSADRAGRGLADCRPWEPKPAGRAPALWRNVRFGHAGLIPTVARVRVASRAW